MLTVKIDENIRAASRELSTDPRLKVVLSVMKARTIDTWANTSSQDQYRREELYRDLQAIGRIEAYFSEIAETDKLADRKAARKQI